MTATPKLNRNPFAQPAALWQLHFTVPGEFVVTLEEAFEDALATSSFEKNGSATQWTVHVLLDHEPNVHEVRARVATLAQHCGVAPPEPELSRVVQQDWQASMQRDFPPLSIGRFFVHGAHARAQRPPHAIPIQVEAGMAFGSGEHATTSGCLLAIDRLARRRAAHRVLDMGCGSAILAIAAAKCWPTADVLAVDIDPISIDVARENICINRCAATVKALVADGYNDERVSRKKPYDLILANILARPLVKLSPALAAHLAPGGVAVLSGLLATQEAMVLSAHRRQGLRLTGRIVQDGWAALVLAK